MSKLSDSRDVLASIKRQKRLLRQEIAASQTVITDSARALVSPVTRVSGQGRSVGRLVSRGMAIWEGVRIGLRLVRSVRALMGKHRRK